MIALVRVDNRLLHGQVLESWIPRLGIREVWIADDGVAGNALGKAALCLCASPSAPCRVEPLAAVPWAELAAGPQPVLVLIRDVDGLLRARAAGLTPALAPRVNLGNVHHREGRRPVSPSVYLDGPELAALRELAAAGFEIEARALPTDPPAPLPELERRYAAGQ